MKILRLRLINFHNFVDETIEVREGGHLFLLGDNGAGKTTALDAVQYALTGGASMELNAAARVGGKRHQGRTIQGVVLRYDVQRGVINEGGAVAYAVLELVDEKTDQAMCIGVGTEATTLESRVNRWGFVCRRGLDELPLLHAGENDDSSFPATREQLRTELGASDVFFRMTDYRAAVAGRLYGGSTPYDEVCRFWSMAKAYREIVAGARDFAGLFQRLLPGPDRQVFGDIIRSLRSIHELETTLRDIEAQRDYVAGLTALTKTVDEQREAAARYTWLLTFRRAGEAVAEVAALVEKGTALASERQQLERACAEADNRLERTDDAVRDAEAEDSEGVASRLRAARARLSDLTAQLATCQHNLTRADARLREAEAEAEAAVTRLGTRVEEVACRIEGQMPRTDAPAAVALVAELRADARGPWDESFDAARVEAAHRETDAEAAVTERRADNERARMELEASAAEVAALEAVAEERPNVPGFDRAMAALAEAGIDGATPLYQLLEPRAEAAPERLAWLEEMAGDGALATIVTGVSERDEATDIVAAAAPGVRVLARTAAGVTLPDWAAELFPEGEDATALAALAAAVDQHSMLGPIGVAHENGLLEHRGARFVPRRQQPRLLGEVARHAAHGARLVAARLRVNIAKDNLSAAAARTAEAETTRHRDRRLSVAIAEVHGAAIAQARTSLQHCERSVHRERAQQAEERARTDGATALRDEAKVSANALEARASELKLDELQARIEELRKLARVAREAQRSLHDRRAVAESDAARLEASISATTARREELREQLASASTALRARLPEALRTMTDAELEHYVRVTLRGDTFRSTEAVEARIADCQRSVDIAQASLRGDGSAGIANILFAGRFGFAYRDSCGEGDGANQLIDGRGQPAAGVLAGLENTVAEQRSLVTDRSRELMETLIMGSLARELQSQVEHLRTMIAQINRLLAGLSFGGTVYQFRAQPLAQRRELIDIVRNISVLDEDSRQQFREWIDDRLDELRGAEDDEVPDLLDYRCWFDYQLHVRSPGTDGVELDNRVRVLGSGGEQGVPNYLLVLALAALLMESAGAKIRPVLFDEAFYGIDAGRRDQLLRFATELGLQLFVASPDQDGVTPAVRFATTLFVVKDNNCDVHLAPYHYWHRERPDQGDMFAAEQPTEPPARDAECRLD